MAIVYTAQIKLLNNDLNVLTVVWSHFLFCMKSSKDGTHWFTICHRRLISALLEMLI